MSGAADKLEEATLRRHLRKLHPRAGLFALVCDRRFGGMFSSYADAAVAGMAMFGPVRLLIRRIDAPPDPATQPPPPELSVKHPDPVVICGWAFPPGFTLERGVREV
jgi:hypothetical protein